MKQVLVSSFLLWAGFVFDPKITVAWVGVPINVLFACAVGTAAAFAIGDKIESRRKLWGVSLTSWLMGALITGLTQYLLAYFMDGMVLIDGAAAGLGALVSFITRFWLPWLAEVVSKGKWLAWIPFFKKTES